MKKNKIKIMENGFSIYDFVYFEYNKTFKDCDYEHFFNLTMCGDFGLQDEYGVLNTKEKTLKIESLLSENHFNVELGKQDFIELEKNIKIWIDNKKNNNGGL